MIRKASFAGTWYEKDGKTLGEQIINWIDCAQPLPIDGLVKILLVPHAGYRYSAATAAYGYKLLERARPNRIIILGPSHRAYLGNKVLQTSFQEVTTPLGNLKVGNWHEADVPFEVAPPLVDENEHSLEMQFPFIRHCCPEATILPLMVSSQPECQKYASFISRELERPDTMLIISSDFCHWGVNYDYHPELKQFSGQTTSEKIRNLDEKGIEAMSTGGEVFKRYLKVTGNTICGQGPIILTLSALQKEYFKRAKWNLLHYSQSSPINAYDPNQNSVSYVAMAGTIP